MANHTLIPLDVRFWPRVNKNGPIPEHRPQLGPCWIWAGMLNNKGYGKAYLNGRCQYAHRISWQDSVGPIPVGVCILHKCDNRPCVRPDHLFLGTNADNSQDMITKGRNKTNRFSLRTVCPLGHPYDDQNTYYYTGTNGNIWRHCRICLRIRDKANRTRRRKHANV